MISRGTQQLSPHVIMRTDFIPMLFINHSAFLVPDHHNKIAILITADHYQKVRKGDVPTQKRQWLVPLSNGLIELKL